MRADLIALAIGKKDSFKATGKSKADEILLRCDNWQMDLWNINRSSI